MNNSPAQCPPSCSCMLHENKLSRPLAIVSWLAQLTVAVILFQTLYFKFMYAPETQYIFKDMGGRPVATLVGCVELVCALLLITPKLASVGALLSLMTISGAIFAHLTKLGIVIPDPETGGDDGGLLFGLAVTVAVLSLVVLTIRRRELLGIVRGTVAGIRGRAGQQQSQLAPSTR